MRVCVCVCPGIDGAVMEERRRGRDIMNEAQDLLEVARREQTKTALQLQRCQRKVFIRTHRVHGVPVLQFFRKILK